MKRKLNEAAVNVDQAKAKGLALRAVGPTMVLYDPTAMLANLEQQDPDPDQLADNVFGFIEVKPSSGKSKCWDAYMVRSSAAQSGYGPLMYDMAMAIYGKIMPDRNQVTSSAEALWKYYVEKRTDVKKYKFDDVTAPETEDPQDDCNIHYDRDALNFAISDGAPDVSALRRNHQNFMKRAGEAADSLLDTAADAFFRRMY
jgi:hypothetical protein